MVYICLFNNCLLLTLEPTVSFWDCGEFILSAFKLQVGHPPGAPLFLMMGRVATLFAGGDTSKVAVMVNILSAICSGFAIMFLFWTITHLVRKVFVNGKTLNQNIFLQLLAVVYLAHWLILFQTLSGFQLLKVNYMDSPHLLPDWFSGVCLNGRRKQTNHIQGDG